MPLYEYHCADCQTKTETLRPMSKADDPVACRRCKGMHTSRKLSTFVARGGGENGPSKSIAGAGGGCGSCAGGHCGSCGSH